MDTDDRSSDSFGRCSSLASDPYTKHFHPSATLASPAVKYADYSFIAVLALAQRLRIDFLPITWQAPLGAVGRGGQARINQALINVQTSFAFKHFDSMQPRYPFKDILQEIVVLSHPSIRKHQYIVRLEGICWDFTEKDEVWPVLVFEKTHFGDLHDFARSERGRSLSIRDRLELCADIGIAIRDMHANSKDAYVNGMLYNLLGYRHYPRRPQT